MTQINHQFPDNLARLFLIDELIAKNISPAIDVRTSVQLFIDKIKTNDEMF